MRVRNIFICSRLVFWASSRIIKLSSRVRPRMYARGATSIFPRSRYFWYVSAPSMSKRASYRGRRYGSTLLCKSPGRNPSRSPASTAGRVRIMRLTCLSRNAATAAATARYVLPVPAGPTPMVTVFLVTELTYRRWPMVLAFTGRPLAVMQMTSAVSSLTLSSCPLRARPMT